MVDVSFVVVVVVAAPHTATVSGGVAHAGAAGVAGDTRHDSRGVRTVPVEVEREPMWKGESRVKAIVSLLYARE